MQISEYGKRDSGIVLIQPVDDHDLSWIEIEAGWIREYAGMDFRRPAAAWSGGTLSAGLPLTPKPKMRPITFPKTGSI